VLPQRVAEQPGRVEESRGIELLVPDCEDRVIDEGLPQRVRRFRWDGLRQIDPADLGADMIGLLGNREHIRGAPDTGRFYAPVSTHDNAAANTRANRQGPPDAVD
jgi:hypothetical protein